MTAKEYKSMADFADVKLEEVADIRGIRIDRGLSLEGKSCMS